MEPMDNPTDLETSLLVFCNLVLGLIFFCGSVANSLVLLVLYRKTGLRTIANRFVVNLMVINILSCISLLPLSFSDNSAASSDRLLCIVTELSSVFCSSVIIYSVLLIAVDQYFAVVNPLHYHFIISSSKSYVMIVSAWCFSAVLSVLGAIQPNIDDVHNSIFRRCGLPSELDSDFVKRTNRTSPGFSGVRQLEAKTSGLYRTIFCTIYAVSVFIIPFGLICFIYYKICAAASGNSKRTRSSVLNNEETSQVPLNDPKEKLDAESNASEKTNEESTCFVIGDEQEKRENMTDEVVETSSLLKEEIQTKPSFVLTRPSPPRTLSETKVVSVESDPGCNYAEKQIESAGKYMIVPRSEDNLKNYKIVKLESDMPFLKPTLKNNSSFSRLSSLHIQFSTSTEKINERESSTNERRHSNVPITVVDPEFENITKGRSPSIQSNSFEITSRSSSTRSTIASQMKSSRSSSLNSNCGRHPASRASSIRSTSSYIVHNIRHRISNASLFRYREEARAARISAMVIVMALACWLPFFTIFYLHSGIHLDEFSLKERIPHYFDSFSVVFLLLSTVLSPFLFAFRNRKIKKEIRKIFRFHSNDLNSDCAKSFYKYNFSLDMRSQTAQLLLGLNKKGNVQHEMSKMSTISY